MQNASLGSAEEKAGLEGAAEIGLKFGVIEILKRLHPPQVRLGS